jgi:ethanolaminephosphotransferase
MNSKLVWISVYSIAQACKEKQLKKLVVFSNVFGPLVITGCAIYNWLGSPASIVFTEHHFILFAIFIGFVFGEMASDIILAHLTKSPYPRFMNIYFSLFFISMLVNVQGFFNV